jgi:hypothetical protein
MTYQVHEELILNGEPAFMFNFPDIPRDHPRILHEFHREPAENIKEALNSLIGSTACWRNYIGTWEVRDGQFFLKQVIGQYKIDGPDPVPATWFSGTLRLPQGDYLDCFTFSLNPLHERDLLIKIRKGRVVKQEVRVNCPGFFRRQFSRIPVIGKLVLKSQGQP